MWIGPLGPDTPTGWRAGRGIVDVDSASGALFVEVVDLRVEGQGPPLELRRVHTRGQWRLSLDERIDITVDGLLHHDLEGAELLLVDPPVPEGLADDGMWPVGTLFGEGRAIRTERGYEITGLDHMARFDTEGRLVRLEDEDGDGMNLEHDELGLARVRADDGRSVRVLHDLNGNISAVAAPGGEEHFYQWDGARLLASIGEGGRVRLVHEGDDLSAIIWPDGSHVRIRYAEDRVVDIAGPGPLRRQLSWDGETLDVVDQRGASWRIRRSADQVTVTDPLGREARTLLEGGRLAGWVAPDGTEVRVGRDSEEHITTVERWRLRWVGDELMGLTDPAGGVWAVDRDALGRLTSVEDPEGRIIRYERDAHGRIVAVGREASPWRITRDAKGLVVDVTGPTGATTYLTRDTRGRVTSIADPSGAETLLGGFAGDSPGTILGRAGSLWVLAYDHMGRAIRVEVPDEPAVTLRRDRLGDIVGIDLDGERRLRLRYRSDGLLTRVEDALGQAWGVLGDAAGRAIVAHQPDGTEQRIKWTDADRLVGLDDLVIKRDARGNPTSDGLLTWRWDLLDRLIGVEGPALDLSLLRGGAGFVHTVTAGELSWPIGRDTTGRVTRIGEGDDSLAIRRNAGGHIVEVDGVILERDDRGLVFRMHSDGRIWRALHDAETLTTRWSSQDGVSLSLGRDNLGRVVLVRYPDGTLLRRAYEPGMRGVRIEGSDGAVLLDRLLTLDEADRVERITDLSPSEQEIVFHRDPAGELVAREQADGAWLWAPGQVSAPHGGMVVYDERGKPVHATPPVGPLAWNTSEDVLSYLVDDAGCIEQVIGEAGAVDVTYDSLGRPTELRGPGEDQRTELEWDELGRLTRVGETRLVWGVSAPLALDAPEGRVEVLHAEDAGWVLVGDRVVSLVPDSGDTPRALIRDSIVEGWLDWSPLGFPAHDAATPIGPDGSWVLGPGGPLVDGSGLLDPVSGTHACRPIPEATWSATPWPTPDGASTPWWDPAPWSADDVWRDPLGLLVALGALDPGVEGGWVQIGDDPPPLPWLPRAAATPDPPLFPGRNSLPLGDYSALTLLVLERSLPVSGPLARHDILNRVTAADLAARAELQFFERALPPWASSR